MNVTTAISANDKQKYSHPIPNRHFILGLLKNANHALSRKQLANKMALSAPQSLEALRRRLRAMERDGQISFDQRDGYRIIRESDLSTGRVVGHPDGFGFVKREEGGNDLVLNERQMLKLFDGDRVQVRITGTNKRAQEQASVISILERNTTELVGQLICDNGQYLLRPHNKRIAHDIDVDADQLAGAKVNQYVKVKITDYPTERYNAYGKIIEVLGDADEAGIEIKVVLDNAGIPHSWPETVLDEANAFSETVVEADKMSRIDLRHLPFVTIDGDDAQDFDDAVYCQAQPKGGWHLSVAIADVSHYVKPGTALDNEAQERGTSVYFPGRVVPMLPENLSNGLCSLKPHVDRLVLVCEMQINQSGHLISYCFSEAVIQSHARLTYQQVNTLLTDSETELGNKLNRQYAKLEPQLQSLYKLYGALRSARIKRGAIDFDSNESTFQFDQQNKVIGISPVLRNDAHKLIEECMLCANVATAQFLTKMKLPSLFRNHHGPKAEKLKVLRLYLAEKGLTLGGGKKPSGKHYEQLLSRSSTRTDAAAIQAMLLRSLSQAEYSHKNAGHFGLGFSGYTHFTSPIRRYPDLLTHRAIRPVIRGQKQGGFLQKMSKVFFGQGKQLVKHPENFKQSDRQQRYPYGHEQMSTLGRHCSDVSRRADKASWEVEAWFKCNYMQDAIGQNYKGRITTVTSFGLFIELDDSKIEGLLHIRDLHNDFYHFENIRQCLKGERNGKEFAIGDSIHIKVAHVDMGQKKIAFCLV